MYINWIRIRFKKQEVIEEHKIYIYLHLSEETNDRDSEYIRYTVLLKEVFADK